MNILSMLSVLGYAVSAVDAKWTKRSHETERWEIARETNGVMNMDPTTWTPKPTAVPGANLVEMELMKRAGTSTCGYYAEYTSSAAVICQGTAQCIVNDLDSAVGCCRSSDAEDCTIPTACLPSQIASLYSDANAYTILCTSAAYPNCVTYSYDQYDPLYSGYSALGCGAETGVYSVEYYAPILGSAVTTTGRTSTSSRTLTSGSSKTSTTDSDSIGTISDTSSTSSTGTGAVQPTSITTGSEKSSGNHTGAIVGGVVGGIGGLALIGLGIFFLIRHSKKNKGDNVMPPPVAPAQNNAYYSPPPGTDPSVYGQPPQMAQTPQQFAGYPPAGFVAADHRTSLAPSTYYDPQSPKPSQYDMSTGPVSPTGSPPPSGPTPPLAGMQQPQYQPYRPPEAQQYQPYNHNYAHATELPTARPDGEVRELA